MGTLIVLDSPSSVCSSSCVTESNSSSRWKRNWKLETLLVPTPLPPQRRNSKKIITTTPKPHSGTAASVILIGYEEETISSTNNDYQHTMLYFDLLGSSTNLTVFSVITLKKKVVHLSTYNTVHSAWKLF